MWKKHIQKFIIKNNYYLPKQKENISHPSCLIFNKWAKEKAKKYPEVKKWFENNKYK